MSSTDEALARCCRGYKEKLFTFLRELALTQVVGGGGESTSIIMQYKTEKEHCTVGENGLWSQRTESKSMVSQLCDLEQVTYLLCVLASSSVE